MRPAPFTLEPDLFGRRKERERERDRERERERERQRQREREKGDSVASFACIGVAVKCIYPSSSHSRVSATC